MILVHRVPLSETQTTVSGFQARTVARWHGRGGGVSKCKWSCLAAAGGAPRVGQPGWACGHARQPCALPWRELACERRGVGDVCTWEGERVMPTISASGNALASRRLVPPMPQPQSRIFLGWAVMAPDHLSISNTKSFFASMKSLFL